MELYRRTLECGAKFIGYNFAGANRNIAMGIGIPRGSAHDPSGLEGAHHFLEHLLFKTSINGKRNELVKRLEDQGGTWNAETDYLNTLVYTTVLEGDQKLGVSFLTELAGRPPEFSHKEMGIERKVVYREIGGINDNPASLLLGLAQSELYAPPFGGLVRGTEESVGEITAADMMDLWQKSYNPSHFTIAAVGNVDLHRLAEEFDRRLKKNPLAGNGNGHTRNVPIIPRKKAGAIIVNEGLALCHFGFGIHAPAPTDHLFGAFNLMDNFLTHGTFSKIKALVRERRGESYDIAGEYDFGRGYGYYIVHGGITPNKAQQVYTLICRGFEAVKHMTQDDLRRVKKRAEKSVQNTEYEKEDIVSQLLYRENDGRRAESFLTRAKNTQAVTLDEIRQIAEIQEPVIVAISPKLIKF